MKKSIFAVCSLIVLATTTAAPQEPADAAIEEYLPPRLRTGAQASGPATRDTLLPEPIAIGITDRLRGRGAALAAFNDGLIEAQAGRHADAAKLLGKAVEGEPSLPEARYAYGLELARLKHLDLAQTQLQEACKLRPSYLQASALLSRVTSAIQARAQQR